MSLALNSCVGRWIKDKNYGDVRPIDRLYLKLNLESVLLEKLKLFSSVEETTVR